MNGYVEKLLQNGSAIVTTAFGERFMALPEQLPPDLNANDAVEYSEGMRLAVNVKKLQYRDSFDPNR